METRSSWTVNTPSVLPDLNEFKKKQKKNTENQVLCHLHPTLPMVATGIQCPKKKKPQLASILSHALFELQHP
jgi:hypothetical protein